MAHEILAVKLCELDDQLSRLSSRIHLSETAGHEQLQQEICCLSRENAETTLTLCRKLERSRTELTAILADAYGQVQRILDSTKEKLLSRENSRTDPEERAEEQILLAEYYLDFASQAANQALLLSLKAIDAQRLRQEGRSQ